MPNELARKRRSLLTIIGYLGFAGVCALGVTVWQIVKSETRTAREVERAHQVIDHFQAIHEQFRIADTALRAYMPTGDESFAESYVAATSEAQKQANVIDALMEPSDTGQEELDKLKNFLASRIEQGNQAIRLRREQGPGATVIIPVVERSEKATSMAMAILNHMLQDQRKLLALRQEKEARYAYLLHVLAYSVIIVTQLAAVIIFWMRRWITRLQTGLVIICAMTKRVNHGGVWIEFDVYLKKRFGLKVSHGMSEEIARQVRTDIARLEKDPEQANGA
jgi:CHASE3 domain sensor protein